MTGGTGLLGFQVVRCLLDAGAEVRVMALQPRGPHPLEGDARVRVIWGTSATRSWSATPWRAATWFSTWPGSWRSGDRP